MEKFITLKTKISLSNMTSLKKVICFVREISGDDVYERYLIHWQQHHAQQGGEPQTRQEFFKAELERKWNGVKRCC
jgi:uncharacterized short protein YbdD (DUF466 family)